MKPLLIFITFSSLSIPARSQELLQMNVSHLERKRGILYNYVYNCSDSYCEIRLTLYKDHAFKYVMKTFAKDVFSNGVWSKKGNILSIKSNIQKDNVPIKLIYSNDTSGMINNFKISVVKNLKGELITDGLLRINNDSVQCLPVGGFCIGNYERIDSLKVVFESGLSSRWLKVENNNFNKIIPVVQADFLMSDYVSLHRRYKVLKNSIFKIDNSCE